MSDAVQMRPEHAAALALVAEIEAGLANGQVVDVTPARCLAWLRGGCAHIKELAVLSATLDAEAKQLRVALTLATAKAGKAN